MTSKWAWWPTCYTPGTQPELERRLYALCLRFRLSALPASIVIRVGLFVDEFQEPCWWTDRQLSERISDQSGHHPHIETVRRARVHLEDLGILRSERVLSNSTRLGPLPENGTVQDERQYAQAFGTTLKTLCWEATPAVKIGPLPPWKDLREGFA